MKNFRELKGSIALHLKILVFFSFLLSQAGVSAALVLPANIAKFIEWETQHSPMPNARKSPDQVTVKTILVPESLAHTKIQPKSHKYNLAALQETVNDKTYYRWILHPDDVVHNQKIVDYVEHKTGQVVSGSSLIGFRTSSRTLVLYDERTKHWFMAKMSSDHAGGLWQRGKAWDHDKATRSALVMQHLRRQNALGYKHSYGILQEPVSLFLGDGGTKSIRKGYCQDCGKYHLPMEISSDFAITVRSIKRLQDKDTYFVPLFALFDKEVMNFLGVNTHDPLAVIDTINRYAVDLRANALAELFFDSGLTMSSFHSQQFVLVAKKTPQGFQIEDKLLIRDISDVELWAKYFSSADLNFDSDLFNRQLYNAFRGASKIMTDVRVGDGLFRGWQDSIPFPSLSDEGIAAFQNRFFFMFRKRLSELTNTSPDEIKRRETIEDKNSYSQMNTYAFGDLSVTKSPATCALTFATQP